ncbi:MAG: PIN domain-containing protein [Desulfobacterales bacterium]|nr:PIN domain-containing protein [Desulfobacterales bacterium]
MTETKSKLFALDTSALLTLWNDEPGADEVEKILKSKDNGVIVSFMSYMECYYRIWKNCNREKGREIYAYLFTLPVERIDLSEEILQIAVEIKATCALSVADSWIIATARIKDAILVHKDPEFLQVKSTVQLHNLPFK